ncbi:transcription factor bHLH18-like [Vicia villosa]|uniref:transcription factor bHLH18-like n=1 Tax=Vicia villosa TaxID=3911 RepID=UPI00273B865B|nr:transcription factor bHLH18-like [Vicia villosa]
MTSMEESWTNWLCEMDPYDYSFINQSSINADIVSSFERNFERPSKLVKTDSSSTCSYNISFKNENPQPIRVEPAFKPRSKTTNSKNERKRVNTQESNKKNGSVSKSASHHIPDHIIAERIRREKISQQFIALSALIPNLKKIDKTSVLCDAIKYVKELKEQVKLLEEQSKKNSLESMVDEEFSFTSSCNETSKTNMSLPEVKARLSGKNVVIRILCEKNKAVMVNVYREIEKLHLSVIGGSSLSFGSFLLAITIIAKMDDEWNMSMEKLAKTLGVGLL